MRHRADPGGRGAKALAAVALLLAGPAAFAGEKESIPLPPPRPAEMGPEKTQGPQVPEEPDRDRRSGPPDAASEAADSCMDRLRKAGFVLEPAEPPKAENGLCRIEAPVRLIAVPVPSRPDARVALKDRPILACAFAENFGQWLGQLAAPAMAGYLETELAAVRTGPGFECRNRNRAEEGKLSAHATGQAIDVSGFELADGTQLAVKPSGDERRDGAIASLRKAACGWFTTILGPGSDPSHADHLHVDVQRHGSSDRYRICE